MPSRRRTLSVLGTLTVTGLAGCAGTLDGGGPGENDGDDDDDNEDKDRGASDDETSVDESETEEGETADDATDESEDEDEDENENEIENQIEDVDDDETFLTVSSASGDREIDAVSYGQVESASEPATIDDQHVLPIVLTDEGAESFRDALEEAGAMESPTDSEVTAYHDGEPVHSRRLSEEVIATAEASDFAGPFNVPLDSQEQAEEIHAAIGGDEE